MIFLDQNFIHSIIISLLLINGFYNLSFKLRKTTNSVLSLNNLLLSTYFNFFLIINFTAIFTFNILLFNELNLNLIKIISAIIIIFGLYKPIYLYSFKNFLKQKIKN